MKEIAEVLQSALRLAASEAMPHMAQAFLWRQIGLAAMSILCFVIGLYLLRSALRQIDGVEYVDRMEADKMVRYYMTIVPGVLLSIIGMIASLNNLDSLVSVLSDPQGALLLHLLNK